MEKYTPKTIRNSGTGGYGEMLVELETCPKCKKLMITPPSNRFDSTFPMYYKINFSAQVEAAGWVAKSHIKIRHDYVCTECVKNGLADFECWLCKEPHALDQIKESFGDPQEYLCKKCYETVPAEKWEEAIEKLEEIHKWDFE